MELPPSDIWIKADSFALVEALAFLASRLREDYGVRSVGLRAAVQGEFAGVDLTWSGAIVGSDAIALWETQPMQVGTQQTPLTLGDVLDRHGGEVWVQAHKASQTAWFRLLLPLGAPAEVKALRSPGTDSRPEFYDFDLFHHVDMAKDLSERKLADLHYTVFDTETTGLEPSAGDEIISIGAMRIVNARVLKREVFEQLVDPQRPVSAASARIHGIEARGPGGPADHRRGAAAVPSLLRGHGAHRAQRRLRHALPGAEGGQHRRALQPARARYPPAVRHRASERAGAQPGGHRGAPWRQHGRPAHGPGRRAGDRRDLPASCCRCSPSAAS